MAHRRLTSLTMGRKWLRGTLQLLLSNWPGFRRERDHEDDSFLRNDLIDDDEFILISLDITASVSSISISGICFVVRKGCIRVARAM